MTGGTTPVVGEDALGVLDLFGDPFVADPYPALAALRRSSPVHHDPGTGLWLVSRYADVERILLDPAGFLPDNAQHAVTRLPVPVLRILARAGFTLPPALANNGGPSHTGLRRLVTRFFDASRVSAAVPVIEETARELLAPAQGDLAATSTYDLSGRFASLLPCRVMMRMLGVRGVPAETLVEWSDAALELFYGRPAPDRQIALAGLVGEFHQWLTEQVTDGQSAEGLIGALRGHRLPDGTALDVPTAVAVCFFVLIAGQSTTGQLISTVVRTTCADPSAWSKAAADEDFARAWVEEVLRREPPVTTWRRVAARETELSGVRVPAGAELLLMLMGTGSDPSVFEEPERLCPYRENTRRHLSFGAGRHRCPGALLARTEAAVALHTAARLLPDVRLLDDGEADMLGLLSFRAPRRVPVTRSAAATTSRAPRA
ncbi:cytochrome P450 [Streptomyces sp. NBC_01142]|uniref:cytochrome P450 n=1 Tax=Streptomyces sp. NBC_01142 TaxID=2975865 RepID=UPI00224FA642|nr:cytochrome P450 [Streptomyces sp. NBC_01142]MCX4825255.1 cytochrome P450 [Streptomyces sp. NBC_01142]